jgi:hypothetical protein
VVQDAVERAPKPGSAAGWPVVALKGVQAAVAVADDCSDAGMGMPPGQTLVRSLNTTTRLSRLLRIPHLRDDPSAKYRYQRLFCGRSRSCYLRKILQLSTVPGSPSARRVGIRRRACHGMSCVRLQLDKLYRHALLALRPVSSPSLAVPFMPPPNAEYGGRHGRPAPQTDPEGLALACSAPPTRDHSLRY